MRNHVAHFRDHGVAFPHRILSEKETADFRKEFECMEKAFGGELSYAGNLHRNLRWAYDLSLHPKILDYIAPLLGNEVGAIRSQMLTKYPHTNDYIAWHQDGVNNKWDEEHSLSVWLALSESNKHNGCMQVIPGTHKNSKREHVASSDKNNILHNKSPEIASGIDETRALNLELKPGEISIHHQNIIHGSRPNTSPAKRIGFVMRYINPRYAANMDVVYARSEKIYEYTNPVERPEEFHDKNDPVAYKAFLEKNIMLK